MKRRIGYIKNTDGFVDIVIPPASAAEFRVLVQRAANTWQDMSPDMRDFVDRVLERDHVMGSNMKEGAQEIETKSVPADALTKEEFEKRYCATKTPILHG